MEEPTLAAKLGTTTHLSPLLRKARRLGLGPGELEILAAQRGCRHYSTGTEPEQPLASEREFSNEELAIALLSTALRYDPHSIRCGAAMLSADGNDPRRLARMAVMERCVVPVRHVAEAGRRYEPENRFWAELLDALPSAPSPKSGVLPHPTRFVAMTGFTRQGPGLLVEWQRPIAPSSLLKKPPGEGTGPTIHVDFRGNLVGRVPPRGERDVFQQAARRKKGA